MRNPLAKLLVKSPLPRVSEQMAAVVQCADRVPRVIAHLCAGEQDAIVALAKEISMLEGRADEAKNLVRTEMPVRLFLPVDRRDVLRLVSQIDAIADCAEDVGVLLTLRTYDVPDEMAAVLQSFVQRVMEVVHSAARLVDQLEGLQGSGFGGKPADEARLRIEEIARQEHEADKLQDQCAKILFGMEDEMSAVSIFMWSKVLNKIGDMANHAENVGDQFRLFIAR